MFGVSERLRHHIMFFYELRVLEIEWNERETIFGQRTATGYRSWSLVLAAGPGVAPQGGLFRLAGRFLEPGPATPRCYLDHPYLKRTAYAHGEP